MYEAVTRKIRIRAEPKFLEERSDASNAQFFWSYTITIENEGADTVQLKSRFWRITDEGGHVEEVSGPGVIGETPVLKPGTSYTYTSGCPLTTPSGIMLGHYTMTTEAGKAFEVKIPAFSLDSPYSRRAVN